MSTFPEAALDWLAVWPEVRGLTLGGDRGLPARLAHRGHTLFALASDEREHAKLDQLGILTPVLALPEAIPLDPYQFEVVFCHQGFHKLDAGLALPQIARVLRPGGCLSASYLIRDDSVPWVRRLAVLLRRYDPMAMQGNYGHRSLDTLAESHYFPEVERRAFRIWQPITRDDMVAMVKSQNFDRRLDEGQLDRLIGQVLELYDSAARPGENLKLPFQLLCHRAWVDHSELTGPVTIPDSALAIQV